MKIVSDDQEGLELAVSALKSGEVVVHATETCYGLAADIFNEDALDKLYMLKGMSLNKPVSMMVNGLGEAEKYAEFNDVASSLAKKFWPGPLTLILSRRDFLPVFFNNGYDTVGVRYPDSRVSLALIDSVGGPLTTTSANVAGLSEVYDVKDYLSQIEGSDVLSLRALRPAVIVNSGLIEHNLPSTIVKVVGEDVSILRRGEIQLTKLGPTS